MEVKIAGYIEKATKLNEGEVDFIVSTGATDAYGEKINVDGINTKDYAKNPVILWAHDGFNLPIAKAVKVWKDSGKLMARAKFYLKDDFPSKVYQYVVDGFLNAVSIGGFVDKWGDDGITIEEMTMKEFSVVSVPANPEAVVFAKQYPKENEELNGLARMYARKMLSTDSDELSRSIDFLEKTVATLKELAVINGEPQTGEVASNNIRLVLKQAQMVDNQAEQVIKNIKIIIKE